jgi:hypothetical protein
VEEFENFGVGRIVSTMPEHLPEDCGARKARIIDGDQGNALL